MMSAPNRLLALVGASVFAGLVGLDVGVNGLLGGAPGDTISERLGRARARGSVVARVLCVPLEMLQKDHCTAVLSK